VDFFKNLNELEEKLTRANMREATTAITEARGSLIRQSKPTPPGTGDYIVALVLLLRLLQMYALEKYRQKI
jgi:hypothetical protein